MLTMGVEEEFLLLQPDGAVTPTARSVVRLAGLPEQVKVEYAAYQVETNTAVCTGLEELRRELVRLRLIAADAAERTGARLVASASAPLASGPLRAVTGQARYRELARRFPRAAEHGGTCACHIHIGMPDRDVGVAVLARIRGYLPALLALTVNSPFAGARDTGWASYRYHAQTHWPTFRPPSAWPRAEDYDRGTRVLVNAGLALDVAGIYLLARLSARYPTIEVRVADTCLTVDDTVFFAAVVRALVAALIDDVRQAATALPAPTALVSDQLLSAAYGRLPVRGPRLAAPIRRLLEKAGPQLDVAGDAAAASAGLARLRGGGTGADRQRALWRKHGPTAGFTNALAALTVPVPAASAGARRAAAAPSSR